MTSKYVLTFYGADVVAPIAAYGFKLESGLLLEV